MAGRRRDHCVGTGRVCEPIRRRCCPDGQAPTSTCGRPGSLDCHGNTVFSVGFGRVGSALRRRADAGCFASVGSARRPAQQAAQESSHARQDEPPQSRGDTWHGKTLLVGEHLIDRKARGVAGRHEAGKNGQHHDDPQPVEHAQGGEAQGNLRAGDGLSNDAQKGIADGE